MDGYSETWIFKKLYWWKCDHDEPNRSFPFNITGQSLPKISQKLVTPVKWGTFFFLFFWDHPY